MITIKEAEEILKKEYHVDNFLYVVDELLLPDFRADKHDVDFKNTIFTSVQQLGYSDKCDVNVYEVILNEGAQNRRVTITQETFRILRGLGVNNAIVAFSNADRRNYRFSLLTSKYEFDGEKVVKVLSNPRRYSYSLGYGTKTKTAYDFLIGKGKVNSLDELINRFSVEVVNKQFYNEIALAFTKLVGGQRDGRTFEKELNLYGVTDQNKYAEFAVRLIGRIVFCWFLKEKKSENGIPLIPESMLALDSVKTSRNYYHDTLEPLFFELLNTNQPRRKGKFAREEIYTQIPYLNGGLFSPHADDHYKFAPELQTGQYGLVTIPNDWFEHFYEILCQYNFTVDENTSYDIELSIDPEMLGRIFENLLAEINPETGENAKKSTGSFYTPRDIVDYMVDSSILEHLKAKTGIDEAKLRALISYGKEDDELATFSMPEKKALINALYTVTVLDPACGSGAFPIGMLQKIVYMLQEIDPEANLWFDKATENISFLMRKEFEKKFNAGSLDYIRKLTVIQNSIFGVDIQPIAVEIARLRCFLSLVIEEKVYDDEPNRGINPLPNLDFKFIIANTLVTLPHDSDYKKDVYADQMSLFEREDHISQLKAVREEYFSTNDAESKNELKLAFSEIQKAMFQEALDNHKIASARYQALFQWAPFNNKPTDWFDSEWMFGVKDGFDIVIGNPPYIGFHNVPNKEYNRSHYYTANGKYDFYVLFIERGLQLSCDGGFLSYICPSYFYKRNYGKNTRAYLLKNTSIRYIADFSDYQVFESAQTYTCIFGTRKVKSANNKIRILNEHLSFIDYHEVEQDNLCEPTWVLEKKDSNSISAKVQDHSKLTFGEITLSISQGIVTGNNDVFLIPDSTIHKLALEETYLRTAYKGKDIGSGKLTYGGYKVFYPYFVNGFNRTECISEAELSSKAPNLYRYLLNHKAELLSRDYFVKSNKFWYELWNPRKVQHFYNRKFVFSEIGLNNDFVLADECFYTDSACGAELKETYKKYESFILRWLNSRLATYVYKKVSVPKANGYSIYKNAFLKNMPIILPDNNYRDDMTNTEFEQYLNSLLGISDEEFAVVEATIH